MFKSETMETLGSENERLNRSGAPNAYWGDRGHWYIGIGTNRDADSVTRANFKAFEDNLPDADGYAIEAANHWACGWIEYILIDPSSHENVVAADEMRAGLEDYPVIDESVLSEIEIEDENEAWESWGRSDFEREAEERWTELTGTDLTDAIDWLPSDWLDETFWDSSRNGDVYWEGNENGWYHFSGVAESLEIEDYPVELVKLHYGKDAWVKRCMEKHTPMLFG